LETPVLIPNTEVKLPALMALVAKKLQNHQAVLIFIFGKNQVKDFHIQKESLFLIFIS